MTSTVYYQFTAAGELLLASADHVDAIRARLHDRFTIATYEDALADINDEVDCGYLTELYADDPHRHCEIDASLLPCDPDLWPAPHRGWELSKLLTELEFDQPTSFLADTTLDLPPGLEDEIWQVAKVRGGFMAPDEPYFPVEVADEVLRRLRVAGVDLVPDRTLDAPLACAEGWCSCTRDDADDVATAVVIGDDRDLRQPADAILPWLWIGDGGHVPSGRFDTVITVAPGLGTSVDPLPDTTHVVTTFADSKFQPIDRAPLETAVAASIDAFARGDTVLVRCRAGVNRSALVVGEALARLGWPREALVELIRNRRPQALTNPFFADVLLGVVDTDMCPVRRVHDE